MLHILHHLNYVPVIVVTIIGFAFGALWYSKLLFANAWREEVKLTDEQCKGGSAKKLFFAFLCTFVLTAALDALLTLHPRTGLLGGAKFGLFIGLGIAAMLQIPAALFEGRTCRYRAIVVGHSVLLCVLTAAILGIYR
jgi:uncharacterized protein YacL